MYIVSCTYNNIQRLSNTYNYVRLIIYIILTVEYTLIITWYFRGADRSRFAALAGQQRSSNVGSCKDLGSV